MVDLREDGSFTNGAFSESFGGPPREPESELTQREIDLARSVQVVCEEIILRMARTPIATRTIRDPWGQDTSVCAGSYERIDSCIASLFHTLPAR